MKIAPIDPVFTGEFAFVFLCSAVGTLLLVHALLRFHAVRRVVIERPWLHPNAWSILRIILGIAVPVILWSQLASRGFCFDLCWTATITAVWLLGFAMATDFIDGAIARACGLVSETGKWLDPLADKIVYLPILTYFAWIGWIESPVWLVLLALADFVGTVARPWLTAAATMWGKAKTCLAFGFVGWMVCWRDARFWPDADYVTAFGGMNEGIGWTLALLAVASVVSKIPFRRKGES